MKLLKDDDDDEPPCLFLIWNGVATLIVVALFIYRAFA